jgi:glycosyltransferase involved in cell wall biosynthesis
MKFAMVTTFYPPHHFGGDAMYVYNLSNELARRGHHVTVVHSVDAYGLLSTATPSEGFPNEDGVTLRSLEHGRVAPLVTYLTGRAGLNARPLREALDDEFDVVHFHNVSLVGGPDTLAYGRGLKIYTMHEHWLVCPMHVLWKMNREPCAAPTCLRCSLAFGRPPQVWRYGGLLGRRVKEVDLFLSPSRFTLEAHLERGFSGPIRHLPGFVPTQSAAPAEAASRGRPYFLFVGRLQRMKGVEILLDAFREHADADLLIAGDGPHRKALRSLADSRPNVHFLGWVHPNKLAPLYAGAIAVLVPSIGYETFGAVVLEGFAQKTPAIVHSLGALPEVVEESGGGILYHSWEGLLAALRKLQDDPELRRTLGERGHQAWLTRWSEEPHLAGYFAAIDEARELAGRAGP